MNNSDKPAQPDQEPSTPDVAAPALLPWTTPRLQRLSQAANETAKNFFFAETTGDSSTFYGPS